MEIGRGALRREVARAVYWQHGELEQIVQGEHGLEQRTFDEWHYALLDAEGYVLGHGDHYFDVADHGEQPGDHVRAALYGVIGDEPIPVDEVASSASGKVHPVDAAQGKVSRSGRPHCTACGHKVASVNLATHRYEGYCPNCSESLEGLNPPAKDLGALGVLSAPSLMVAMLHVILAYLGTLLASLSNYAEDAIANAYGNHAAFDVTQSYTKLHTGDPGEDGTNNAAGETTRKSTSYGASSGGVITTDADDTWTAVASTETISHVSHWDASTSGNCLGSGALGASKSVTAGDTLTIPSGSMTVTLT